MATLVDYRSSDEEDEAPSDRPECGAPSSQAGDIVTNGASYDVVGNGATLEAPSSLKVFNSSSASAASFVGPPLGPVAEINADAQELSQSSVQLSPWSADRALLRDLTLPTLPNYDIHPSPPGSPKGSTDAKFKHFLELKKQGVHFNLKLAKSSAMKNPSLMEKLLGFADIDEAGQYESTLPKDLWNPSTFPDDAYKEGLAKSQQLILKKKAEEKARGQRDSVDFVPASGGREAIVRAGASAQKGGSAAERIMAGLDSKRSSLPQAQGTKRKSRFDS